MQHKLLVTSLPCNPIDLVDQNKLLKAIRRFLYEFKRDTATSIIFIFDLRGNVPHFYDTFWVKKITLVAALNAIPDAPWWSVALAHTIT